MRPVHLSDPPRVPFPRPCDHIHIRPAAWSTGRLRRSGRMHESVTADNCQRASQRNRGRACTGTAWRHRQTRRVGITPFLWLLDYLAVVNARTSEEH
ncbi:hypothetical protein FA95DRAFT_1561020 [Auriscalpium vulgare]|uniref:Uncharacterized protein n=1 Tax=Auriscalpium vulgare TaxID=40419 RepID=A0ACB8RNK4_9AGAM|nr:hypothetical protein FA95DRAFT_1561020 [Auriscalpium vulgare]